MSAVPSVKQVCPSRAPALTVVALPDPPCSLIEPKSIRAPTTFVYTTKLIEAAVDAKEQQRLLEGIDQFLLPPALYLSYHESGLRATQPL